MRTRNRLEGTVSVAAAALESGLATIEGMHTAIARKPFAALRVLGGAAKPVQLLHDGITRLVYAGVAGAFAAAGGAARLAAGIVHVRDVEPAPGSVGDLALAALNGFVGARLARDANPLTMDMALRRDGRSIAVDRAALATAFPAASPRLVLFVHGLACSESAWGFNAERYYGDPSTTYASRLERDLGYTPLFLRYNSGLHISANGKWLAELLDRLVAEWPTPVEEIALVGHSMGGLVVRSATHYGANRDWRRLARHVVFLGSPHLGAPLEKATHAAAWVLGRFDVTRPLADIVNRRSAGIKDLRFGALRDEEWPEDDDLGTLLVRQTGGTPLLASASHYFVAATVTRDRRHPLGIAIGDLLVREASALGGAVRHQRFALDQDRHFGPMNHFDLLNHPDVYDQMRSWLSPKKRS